MLRFVVLDDDYIGDDFIGQYSVAFECLQPGYRNVPLLGLAGDPLPHASLFVHVAVTNRRGGGKAQRRGLSVRRVGRRGREYVTLRHTGIKVVDEAFKLAGAPLKEATDLREEAQVRWEMGFCTYIKLFHCQSNLGVSIHTAPPNKSTQLHIECFLFVPLYASASAKFRDFFFHSTTFI